MNNKIDKYKKWTEINQSEGNEAAQRYMRWSDPDLGPIKARIKLFNVLQPYLLSTNQRARVLQKHRNAIVRILGNLQSYLMDSNFK